jgi:uncharacterized integral membrane protein
MNFRTGFSLFVILLLGAFTLVNWTTITAPTTLDFLVATVQAPFGVLFLLILGVVMVTYILMGSFAEARTLREGRATAQEMERLHRLVEQAEDARIAALRADLNRELAAINTKLDRVLMDPNPALGSSAAHGMHP